MTTIDRALLRRLLAGLALMAGITWGSGFSAAGTLTLGFENQEQWDSWQEITIPGQERTRYELDPEGQMVCAEADASVSALLHAFPGELEDYPILTWEWRIEHVLEKGDARKKEGDDYAGRIYVNFERDYKPGWWERARVNFLEYFYGNEIPGQALNFIWANILEVGEIVPSTRIEHARLVALQSGNERAGEWVREEVNILDYYRRAFEGEPPRVHSIAIMTDSDNTGETVRACYRNIRLVAPD